MDPKLVARANLHHLSLNTYPGRGLFMGLSSDGTAFYQGCWTMGRSAGSRNRRYVEVAHGHLRTAVADLNLEKGDPTTTIYNAMCEGGSVYVVSNGRQTDHAVGHAFDPLSIALSAWKYEPDLHTPHYRSGDHQDRRQALLRVLRAAQVSVE